MPHTNYYPMRAARLFGAFLLVLGGCSRHNFADRLPPLESRYSYIYVEQSGDFTIAFRDDGVVFAETIAIAHFFEPAPIHEHPIIDGKCVSIGSTAESTYIAVMSNMSAGETFTCGNSTFEVLAYDAASQTYQIKAENTKRDKRIYYEYHECIGILQFEFYSDYGVDSPATLRTKYGLFGNEQNDRCEEK